MAFNQIGVQTALSVDDTARALTFPSGLPPTHAILQVTGADIRWRADGSDPAANVGILVVAGSNIEFMDPMATFSGVLKSFRAIRTGATSASIHAAYFSI